MSEHQQDPGIPPTMAAEPPAAPPGGAGAASGAAAGAASAASEAFSRLRPAEQMAIVGAGLIVLVEVLLGAIIDEYWSGDAAFLLALAVLAAVYIRHVRKGVTPLSYATIIRVAGVGVAALALIDLPSELRHGVFDRATDILGGAGYYGGAVLMAIGAWSIKDD